MIGGTQSPHLHASPLPAGLVRLHSRSSTAPLKIGVIDEQRNFRSLRQLLSQQLFPRPAAISQDQRHRAIAPDHVQNLNVFEVAVPPDIEPVGPFMLGRGERNGKPLSLMDQHFHAVAVSASDTFGLH